MCSLWYVRYAVILTYLSWLCLEVQNLDVPCPGSASIRIEHKILTFSVDNEVDILILKKKLLTVDTILIAIVY